MRHLRHLGLLLGLSVFWPGGTYATLQDSGFTETAWLTTNAGSFGVSGIAWAPDGSNRLFWCAQDGKVMIIKNGVALAAPFATMSPIRTGGEEGLIGITFDPNFVDNGYVYVYVTSQNGVAEIIRYRASGDTGVERTVLKTNLPSAGNHNGGGIGFGPDGKLYWAIGNNGSDIPLDDLTHLTSKVGRMNPDGTAPNDNPFYGTGNAETNFVWARGFRNPYTLTFQPSTEKLWVNVVGTYAEQIFQVNAKDHAGFINGDRNTEGNQVAPYVQPVLNYWEGTGETPGISSATRSNNIVTVTTTTNHWLYKPGRRVRIAGMPDSSFNTSDPYPPITEIPAPNQFRFAQAGPNATSTGNGNSYANVAGIGRVVLGGTFYDGTQFPEAYRGNFFWGDFSSGNVMRAVMGGPAANKFTSVDFFSKGITQYIDAAVGPDGALYYANYTGTFYRVAYKTSQQGIVLSNQHVRMSEGGRAVVMASLAMAPAGGVQVAVARQSGDTDLTISGGASLSFGPSNWNVPQAITISSAVDGDSDEDVATFTAQATGLASQSFTVKATDSNSLALVLTPASLDLDEGGSPGTFTVRLSKAPPGTVTVSSARSAGDTETSITGGAALSFNSSNWSSPQTVTVRAGNDADGNDETATISVTATGIPGRTVTVNVRDSQLKPPTFTSSAPLAAVVGAPYTYDANATGNPDPTFELTAKPAGMTINEATGVIAWTPAATGSFLVTVRAKNSSGTKDQSFTIKVSPDQPPKSVITRPLEGEAISGSHAEFYGDCVDDVGCTQAEFFVDGTSVYTDKNTFEHYHFNGAHAQFDTWNYANGPHEFKMVVTDNSGKKAEQEIVATVANSGDRPDAGNDAGSVGPDGPATGGDDAGPEATVPPPEDSPGCSCRTSAPAGSAGSLLGAAGLAAALGRRRSKRGGRI
jgi:MYXO-CTERM domain-containing protein